MKNILKSFLPALLACVTFLPACAGEAPADLGVHDGRLSPCPSRPNCVSSDAQDKGHAVNPLMFAGTPEQAQALLTHVIQGMDGARIVTASDKYLRAEFTSKLMKYVDDVELLFDPVSGLIHIRSASRVGYSDMGVNRKRVEAIRQGFNSSQLPTPPG